VRLATFRPLPGAEPLGGIVDGEEVRAFAVGPHAVRDVVAGELGTDGDLGTYSLGEVELLAPIPEPGTIFAIGRNYAEHAAELGNDVPEWPIVFIKASSSVAPPSGPVVCPEAVRRLDYEGELALVIGAGGKVAGYCVADDVSARDLQKREPQWVRAKGADTFCPFGPWVTTTDEIADPENLRVRTWVNGELRQDSSTANLIFGLERIVAFIAETCTLRPGDLILTGTPAGVGQGMDPPQFLGSGDVVRVEVEGLGSIEHPVA
jgi:acylpyruvate hydrolase